MIDILKHLDEVKKFIQTDIVDIAAYHARRKVGSGHFSTPRQVFCFVDHLGNLANGGKSTERAIKFITEYFPKCYKEYAELIYVMWRHGTVHEFSPATYRAPVNAGVKQVEIRWLSTIHNRRAEKKHHLHVYCMDNVNDAAYLIINQCQLSADLMAATNLFINNITNNPILKLQCDKRYKRLIEVRDYYEAGKSIAYKVKTQINAAWSKRGGLIDRKGNIVQPHPNIQ